MSQMPFIDIAVQDTVREAMLDGKAAVLFDASVEQVFWANGAAASLFGFASISEFKAAGIAPFQTTIRQLKSAAARRPQRAQSLLLRVTAGLISQLAKAEIQIIKIDGHSEELVFLSFVRSDENLDDKLLAQDAISGLEADGAGAAIIGNDGIVVTCGALFHSLSLTHDNLISLTREVANEDDRLVKRLITRPDRPAVAVGIGRLSENPVRNLIVAMETEIIDQPDESRTEDQFKVARRPYSQTISSAPPVAPDDIEDSDEEDFASSELDDEDDRAIELTKGPVRFVWKTDIAGHFVDVSFEFAGAVGAHANALVGRDMNEVMAAFDLDPSGDIAASMQRRDTWSGKSVLWPIEGTDLHVPVDLAALPYYNRDRQFEGYRGFGIVRMADAMIDPEERGLSLGISSPAEDLPSETDEIALDDDPFEGEVPALSSSSLTPIRRESDFNKVIPFDQRRNERDTPQPLDENEAEAFKKIRETLSQNTTVPEIDDQNQDELTEPESAALPDDDAEDIAEHLDINNAESETNGRLGLGPDHLNALPLPLLIVRDEEALFGNNAFASLTGYDDIAALNKVGVSALFGDETVPLDVSNQSGERGLALIDASGEKIAVRAHLQLVPWLRSTALMFAFEPKISKEQTEPKATSDQQGFEPILDAADSFSSEATDEIAEMRAILDTATDGVVVIAQDGSIRSINSSASALFGYTSDDVVGKSFSILFANESQRSAMDYLDGFSNNSVVSLLNEGREVLARERNGGYMPVFMTIGKLPTQNGYCAVLRDITPWKQTEQALEDAKMRAEEASTIKSEFLAKISHEIRTPLNAIIGFSELMSEERFGPVGNPRYKDYLIDINKSGRHVLDLVNDLLDISKIEAGEQDLDFQGVLLNEAIADAISMVQPQANRNRIIVRSSLDSKLPSVVADLRSVKQIVLNLLSNAVRFTRSGGQVVVSTNYTTSGAVTLRISDTGVGMTSKEIETALRPFQQISHQSGVGGDGTGLGLPLTKALVEANRAEFDVASEPGRGTTVEITFPPTRVLAD
jgi:PAS domain S-box-containing protein